MIRYHRRSICGQIAALDLHPVDAGRPLTSQDVLLDGRVNLLQWQDGPTREQRIAPGVVPDDQWWREQAAQTRWRAINAPELAVTVVERVAHAREVAGQETFDRLAHEFTDERRAGLDGWVCRCCSSMIGRIRADSSRRFCAIAGSLGQCWSRSRPSNLIDSVVLTLPHTVLST